MEGYLKTTITVPYYNIKNYNNNNIKNYNNSPLL